MTRIAIIANLVAYSIIVSQPLFYMLAMTSAQRALSAPAYVELRQPINSVMSRRVPVIYSITLVTVSILLVLSFSATTLVALVCLLVDIVFMMRENVPINRVIDRWSTTDYPEDWETYRTKWFAIFAYRQVVLLVGFLSLLFGAVFQT
jgi:hypothetical protein